MIKTAMLSYWHVHANDYAKQADTHPDVEITAIWDEIPKRGKEEADKRGVPFFESLETLLKEADIEAVIVDVPTNLHTQVITAAARAGKHIFTEKVLAPTAQECREILHAVEESGIKLTVSLPRLNDPYTLAIQEILKQGDLGELTLVRARLSHGGATAGWLPEHFYSLEECLGGAMIDLGCHPMYLTRLFLGLPETVSAQYGFVTGKEVEDNAVAVLGYENGAVGIVEAGFVNAKSPFTIEIHGTQGSLLFGTPEGKLLVNTSDNESGWQEISLPSPHISAFEQWVEHIQSGTSADENIALAVDLTRLMEAANLSHRHNRRVGLSELKG